MDVRLVDRPDTFAELLQELAGAPIIAIDTEAASFHRYHDRIYLIQVSTPTQTAVIDPLGVDSLKPIGELLADPGIEKVFHDADYDLRLFDREFGFHARSMFDTRIAAQFLGEPGVGLGALLQKYFAVTADKRFQRADWSARPLSDAMLDYAAGDTNHLCQLRDILRDQLTAKGRLNWVEEEFVLLENTRWTGSTDEPAIGYLRLKGAKALDRRSLALLRELFVWREGVASKLDRAGFRVAGNEVLFELAQRPPRTAEALGRVKGVGRDTLDRRGGDILAAIERGLAVPDDLLPKVDRPPRRVIDLEYEARLESLKKARNAIAQRFDLAPGVLCPNGTLEAIAHVVPDSIERLSEIREIRKWQVREFGSDLLNAVSAGSPSA